MSVWDALVGQEDTVEVLRTAALAARETAEGRAAAAGAMTHSWLFTGPAGSGRSVAARALAAALQCTDPDAPGCGACSGCHTVLAGSHPDVRMIVPEGLSISVAEMRNVVSLAARRPALGRWQVVVIEDADRLTEGAFNALLKMVEEPPPRTVFLLCAPSTHPDDVAVTIRSRCRLVSLRIPPADAVARVLLADGIDPETAHWAAQASQGHVGRARRLARARPRRTRDVRGLRRRSRPGDGHHPGAALFGGLARFSNPSCNSHINVRNIHVNGHEFERKIRKIGRNRGVVVSFDQGHGKGSHGRLYYGNRFTTL